MLNNRGLTMIEIVIVIVLIGLMAGLAFPRLGAAIRKQDVRSARAAVATMHAKARATAIQRASGTVLHLTYDAVHITSRNPVSGVDERVGDSLSVYNRYGVTLSYDKSELAFDARGLGTEASTTTIYVRKGPYLDSLMITSIGRVLN